MNGRNTNIATTKVLTKIMTVLGEAENEWKTRSGWMSRSQISTQAITDKIKVEDAVLWLCNHGLVERSYNNRSMKVYRIRRRNDTTANPA